jgi:outer membrane protein assembly factor BamE
MKRIIPVLAATFLLGACTTVNNTITTINPFKIDVRQGNYVTQEMVAQLKQGQTKDQVRYILGSPLLVDAFHTDRWDYVYRFQPGRGEAQQRHLIVYFQDNRLVRVAGDVVAGESGEAPPRPPMQTLVIENPNAKPKEAVEAKPAEPVPESKPAEAAADK